MPTENYAMKITGKLKITKAGDYTFYTKSDDGSSVKVDDQMVVEQWQCQGATEKSGTVTLTAGVHAFEALYTQGAGGKHWQVFMKGPDTADGKKIMSGTYFADISTPVSGPPTPSPGGAPSGATNNQANQPQASGQDDSDLGFGAGFGIGLTVGLVVAGLVGFGIYFYFSSSSKPALATEDGMAMKDDNAGKVVPPEYGKTDSFGETKTKGPKAISSRWKFDT